MMSGKRERILYRTAWGLLLVLIFITAFGSWLMPHGITQADWINFTSKEIDGKKVYESPPFAPSLDYWLGTDHRGFDILSLLLHGAKYTLGYALLITVTRFLFAVPIGLYVGIGSRGRSVVSNLAVVTSAVPAMLYIFPMLYTLQNKLTETQSTIVLFVMFVVLGVFPLSHQFAERAGFYNNKLYITSSRLMGASTSRIMFRHVLPHLRPEVTFSFLTDLGYVLFLIGQLSILNVFLGGREEFLIGPMDKIFISNSGEWGAMIAYGVRYIQVYPWILGSAAIALTLSTLTLWFFSAQLQNRLNKPQLYTKRLKWRTRLPKPSRTQKTWAIGYGIIAAILIVFVQSYQAFDQTTGTEVTEKSANEVGEKYRPYLQKTLQSFVDNLVAGKPAYVQVYLDPELIPANKKQLPPVLETWQKALESKEYQYQGVGSILLEDRGDIKKLWYKAELKMKKSTGEVESWFVIMDLNLIHEVQGGPAV